MSLSQNPKSGENINSEKREYLKLFLRAFIEDCEDLQALKERGLDTSKKAEKFKKLVGIENYSLFQNTVALVFIANVILSGGYKELSDIDIQNIEKRFMRGPENLWFREILLLNKDRGLTHSDYDEIFESVEKIRFLKEALGAFILNQTICCSLAKKAVKNMN